MSSITKSSTDFNGSKKHVLKWVGSDRVAFSKRILNLIKENKVEGLKDIQINETCWWFPVHEYDSKEIQLTSIKKKPLEGNGHKLLRWWIDNGSRTPQWDFVCSAEINGSLGVVIVEAKAHIGELKKDACKSQNRDNQNKIKMAIKDTNTALKTTSLKYDSHYQMSNRVAFAWKLASMEIPVILIYLGFCGDKHFPDRFEKDTCENLLKDYIGNVFPVKKLSQEIPCGKASFWFIVRSMECP